jgi:hypothetical protein
MSYLRASTANPNGWRPGTVRLGEMRRPVQDWKVAVANHAAAQHAYDQQQKASRGRAMAGMALVDARARGVRMPVRGRGLSGMGSLDPSSQMVKGATYVFHFTCAIGLGIGCPSLDSVRNAVATDANFANPSPGLEGNGGMYVAFSYNGQGSNIIQAAGEMANVIQSNVFGYARFVFVSADGPAISSAATVIATNPDGTVSLSDGSTVNPTTGVVINPDGTTSTTSISLVGSAAPSSGSGLDLTSLFSGLGIGTGTGILLALGAVFLLKD